jgi:HK97 family phage major capsid protein
LIFQFEKGVFMKRLLSQMKAGLLFVLACLFGLQPMFRPDENQKFTFLRHDGKSMPRNSMPGDLLTGLSGTKEDDDLADASRKLQQKLEGIKEGLKSDLQKHLVKLETDLNGKIAAMTGGSSVGISGDKEAAALQGELLRSFMKTGTVSGEKAERLRHLTGVKDATAFTVTDNAFTVPVVIDQQILQLLKSNSTLLSRVNTVVAAAGYTKVMLRAGASGRASETSERTVRDAPSAFEVAYEGGELYARYRVSAWALDDAGFNVEAEFMNAIAEEFGSALEHEIVAGGGTTEMAGLNGITADESPAFGQLRAVVANRTENTVFGYEDLLATVLSVPKRLRANCTWIVSPTTLASMLCVEDDMGNKVFIPPTTPGETGMLLGYPVEESEDLSGERLAYFANLSRGFSVHYISSTKIIRDPFTVKGFVELYVSKRVRGAVADTTGISVLVTNGSLS